MKTIISVILAVFLFSTSELFAFRVMTFNLWTGKEYKKERIIDVIRKANPNVVILNEANYVQVFNEIADRLGYKKVLSESYKYHVGILSKYEILDAKIYDSPLLAKSLVKVKLSVPELDKPLYVFACHLTALDLSRRAKHRVAEIDFILSQMEEHKGDYIILAGDMNEVSHLDKNMPESSISRTIQTFGLVDSYRAYSKDSKASPGFTHMILWIPSKRIDYIYSSSNLAVTFSKVLDKKFYRFWPSDHGAVISDFKIEEDVNHSIKNSE